MFNTNIFSKVTLFSIEKFKKRLINSQIATAAFYMYIDYHELHYLFADYNRTMSESSDHLKPTILIYYGLIIKEKISM